MEKKQSFNVKELVIMGLMAAVITVCSWISIAVPSAVPFTLQTFAVFCTAGLLGTKKGTLTVLAYIILGAIGVPVFAGFKAGMSVLGGMTGGYILGFLLMVPVIGIIIKKLGQKAWVLALAFVLGLAVCYAFGTAWFIYFYTRTVKAIGIASALSMCVVPYLIPDAIKIMLAVFVVKKVSPIIKLR